MIKKDIFIVALVIGIVLSFIFRPSKDVDYYEDEINNLKSLNMVLSLNNDSLSKRNSLLGIEIKEMLDDFDSTQILLTNTKDKLNDLENDKGKVSNYVNALNVDGVTNELAEYLNRRQ